jgi:hypothetical protein
MQLHFYRKGMDKADREFCDGGWMIVRTKSLFFFGLTYYNACVYQTFLDIRASENLHFQVSRWKQSPNTEGDCSALVGLHWCNVK